MPRQGKPAAQTARFPRTEVARRLTTGVWIGKRRFGGMGTAMARVVLAMSGGVDSSVAAHLLRQAGHDVVGVFMRHGQPMPEDQPACSSLPIVAGNATRKQGCCSAEDAADARRVADLLDIPFYALNLQADFGRIIDYFVADYLRGRTPNPCVVCNQWLKFGRLFDYADSVDAEFVATGHYARCVLQDDSTHWLCRGVDPDKDQSYVLFGIDPTRLRRMLLPVGAHHKSEIRALAAELGLRVADKRDSQEICFVPPGEHGEFVKQRRGERDTSGRIVTTDGTIVGRHGGIEQFTIGQRKGLGVAMGNPISWSESIPTQATSLSVADPIWHVRPSWRTAPTGWRPPQPTVSAVRRRFVTTRPRPTLGPRSSAGRCPSGSGV